MPLVLHADFTEIMWQLHLICRKKNQVTWEQRAIRGDFNISFISTSVDHCSRLIDSCLLCILLIECILSKFVKMWVQYVLLIYDLFISHTVKRDYEAMSENIKRSLNFQMWLIPTQHYCFHNGKSWLHGSCSPQNRKKTLCY
jgi:hypothetical protein